MPVIACIAMNTAATAHALAETLYEAIKPAYRDSATVWTPESSRRFQRLLLEIIHEEVSKREPALTAMLKGVTESVIPRVEALGKREKS